jgi:hypothetical protein
VRDRIRLVTKLAVELYLIGRRSMNSRGIRAIRDGNLPLRQAPIESLRRELQRGLTPRGPSLHIKCFAAAFLRCLGSDCMFVRLARVSGLCYFTAWASRGGISCRLRGFSLSDGV